MFFDVFGGGVEEGETTLEALKREGNEELGADWVQYFSKPLYLGNQRIVKDFAREGQIFSGTEYWYYAIELTELPKSYRDWAAIRGCATKAPTNNFSDICFATFENAMSMVSVRSLTDPSSSPKIALLRAMLNEMRVRELIA